MRRRRVLALWIAAWTVAASAQGPAVFERRPRPFKEAVPVPVGFRSPFAAVEAGRLATSVEGRGELEAMERRLVEALGRGLQSVVRQPRLVVLREGRLLEPGDRLVVGDGSVVQFQRIDDQALHFQVLTSQPARSPREVRVPLPPALR